MPPITTTDSYVVGKNKAKAIYATPEYQARIVNNGGGKLFYKVTSDVTTSDTEVASASAFNVENTVWVISNSRANITVEHREAAASPLSAPAGFYTWQPPTAESGTDTAFAEKKLFMASIFIPVTKTITGVGYLLGAGGGTNKVIAALVNSQGQKVANSSETTEGTVAGTEKTVQELAFVSPFKANGPGQYFIGITANGATAKLRTIPANTAGKNIFTGEISLSTKNVVPSSITVPTEWVAAKGPVAFVY
jgi:hypothetical protein